jgi:hypothetical protein
VLDEEATGANGANGANGASEVRCCGWEADAECGGDSLAVSAGGPAPLEVPARTWDVLVEAGCSYDEPPGAITWGVGGEVRVESWSDGICMELNASEG